MQAPTPESRGPTPARDGAGLRRAPTAARRVGGFGERAQRASLRAGPKAARDSAGLRRAPTVADRVGGLAQRGRPSFTARGPHAGKGPGGTSQRFQRRRIAPEAWPGGPTTPEAYFVCTSRTSAYSAVFWTIGCRNCRTAPGARSLSVTVTPPSREPPSSARSNTTTPSWIVWSVLF